MSQLSEPAKRLNIPEDTLRKFCLEVQSCFRDYVPCYVPSFHLITTILEKHPGAGSLEVARLLIEKNQASSENKYPSSVIPAPKPALPRQDQVTSGGKYSRKQPKQPKKVRNSWQRNSSYRIAQDKLEKCPHGIPLTRVCAICEPERFRRETGID